ncbi:DUF2332 domain-containing protein [Georgenia halophila]|uniref:DUF2332 domain-containing protein n=1 Tax=Georgenia halophila TaxID=620889 RepID=UPI0031EB8B5C
MSKTADFYRRWAQLEAEGVSPLYYDWALGVAADTAVLEVVEALPPRKRQPNLVFAAARAAGAPSAPYSVLWPWLLEHWGEVREITLTRMTQTNEAGRCAVLLPVLSRLPGPLALIEVGASAGLCLYPDRYSYSYATPSGTTVVDPPGGPSPVRTRCAIDADSVPETVPEVAWRAGIDLNPVDVRNETELNWLETLIWPEHEERRQRLRAAAAVVAADPPRLLKGDLFDVLPALVEEVPAGTQLVIFHSAVLAYLERAQRERFVELVRGIDGVWLSNEGAQVLPRAHDLPEVEKDGHFVLTVDGTPVARTGPHGQAYDALASYPEPL